MRGWACTGCKRPDGVESVRTAYLRGKSASIRAPGPSLNTPPDGVFSELQKNFKKVLTEFESPV